jgi:hypothetical protein
MGWESKRRKSDIKVMTVESHPNSPIMRACNRAKLTNFTITWYPAGSRTPGYILECDQIPWLSLRGNYKAIITRINSFQWVGDKLKY